MELKGEVEVRERTVYPPTAVPVHPSRRGAH